ncbi:DUF748 domain-containing protein [Termitidicoccus mucosus]|uniref:DUF748 domain-containing protein n=1 Tax=Termitidicoccus mucosus TaxID=1184151 RepID=A0A178IJQ9_9BACT|nr:hypothetical protein AW736_10060 [Opitutaceae bacterium TSB47]
MPAPTTGNTLLSTPDKPARRRWPRWARVLRACVLAVALLVLAGFFAAPPLARNILEKQLTKALSSPGQARTVRIDRVRINPLAFSCAIEGLTVTAADHEPFVRWRSLFASLDLRTLVTREWRFRKISLDGFNGRITVREDGRLDFADLYASAPPRQPSGKSTPLHINELVVTGAHIDYADASLPQPFATQLGPMSFTVRDFQTGGHERAPGEFAAATESGETFSWQGTLALSPLASRGEIRIGNLSIKKYTPFYGHRVRFDVLDGKMDIALRYEIAVGTGRLSVRARRGALTLRDLKLAERGQAVPAVAIGTLALSGITIDSQSAQSTRQALHVEHIALDNSTVALRHDAGGLSLARLFTPADAGEVTSGQSPMPVAAASTTQPSAVSTAPASLPPEIVVGELIARNTTIDIEDTTLALPLRTQAVITTLGAKNFSLEKLDEPLALELAAQLPGGGLLRAGGRLALSPLKGRLSAEISGAPLVLARSHAGQYLDARIDGGLVNANAVLDIDPAAGFTVTGDAAISDFAATDAAGSPVQSWQNLALRGVALATHPALKIAVREIALDGAATQMTVLPDGKLNLSGLLKPAAGSADSPVRETQAESPRSLPAPAVASGTASTPSPASAPGALFAIEKIALSNSRVDFSDRSIAPAVNASLDHVGGTISGLSSEGTVRADVDLHARIDGTASISLTGQVNPFGDNLYSDLRLAIDNAALSPLDPYVGKYAGRALAAGTLDAAVGAKISQRRLNSSNVITLNQFALGAPTGSPDATSLPVGLAVSLLRDRSGKIVLDIPVEGSLDDPDFRYGRAVWRAVGNLLVKAATAPFSLLASLIGGSSAAEGDAAATAGEKDYSSIGFDPGATTPSGESLGKLSLIAQALRERPALQLSVTGGYDAGRDRAALRHALLLKQLDQESRAEFAQTRDGQPSAEAVKLAPADEARLVERLYRRHFQIPEQTAADMPSAEPAPRPAAGIAPSRIADNQESSFVIIGGKMRPGSRNLAARRPVPAAMTPPAAISAGPVGQTSVDPAEGAPAGALPSQEEMRARLSETIQVNEDQLRQLASARAGAVKNYLVGAGVEANRIMLADAPSSGASAGLELMPVSNPL